MRTKYLLDSLAVSLEQSSLVLDGSVVGDDRLMNLLVHASPLDLDEMAGELRLLMRTEPSVVKRQKDSINNGLMHVADIMPTLLEIAGASYPKSYAGHELPPLIGKSWGPMLAGQMESPRTTQDYLAWEIFGNHAVRQGEWKLRWQYKPFGKGDWELFNVTSDPAERKDLAAERPDKLREMIALWDNYALTNNVILPNRSVFETLEDQLPPRVPDDSGYPPMIYKRQFVPPKDMVEDPKP